MPRTPRPRAQLSLALEPSRAPATRPLADRLEASAPDVVDASADVVPLEPEPPWAIAVDHWLAVGIAVPAPVAKRRRATKRAS